MDSFVSVGNWEVVGSSDVDGLNNGKSIDVCTSEADGNCDCKGRKETSNNITSLNLEKPPPEIISSFEEIVYVLPKPFPYKSCSMIVYLKHKVFS